ncbi:hypothetical protein [Jiangella aurantiaca]|uniref:hypothetical protein n=1 Tax=Jiangella aurantiaca TaxID=2530373 RepID=UPI0013A5C0BD|nr:hypothetical protein [Jiangella aurantiaca]
MRRRVRSAMATLAAAPVFDAVDDTIAGGQFGLNVDNGTAVIQNVQVGPVS